MIKRFTISEDSFLGSEVYNQGLGNYELKEGKWVLEIKKEREVRSINQNRMYWGYVLPSISLETGYEVDELHEYFKSLMETKEVVISKTAKEIPVSTTKMDTKQFTEYIERIRQFCLHNLGLAILREVTIDQIREMEERHKNRH